MRRLLLLFLAYMALALFVAGEAKHPFTFEDMMKMKRVGDPQVSPDGKWLLFSVVDVDLAANTKTPHIWIVPTVGGQEREIISDQDADRPRWAPEGKRFAFLSSQDAGSQVWIADFDGAAGSVSAVHKLTSIATEASGELWSPDGKNILFTSDVFPKCDRDSLGRVEALQCNENELKSREQSKVKAQIFDHLLYRHWNAYKEGKRTHIFLVSSDPMPRPLPGNDLRFFPLDLTPGDYDAPVFSLGGQDDYAFSPDGQEICYASNHDKNPAASTNNDLWIVSLGNGVTTDITADNPASDTSPLYSPDGRYIAYRAQQRPGYESDRFRLMLYDRKTGQKKSLTEKFDAWVGTFTWTPDSKTIAFAAEQEGNSPIYVASPDGDLPSSKVSTHRKALAEGFNDDPAFTPDGKTLVFTTMSLQGPTGISSLPVDSLWLASTRGSPLLSCAQINAKAVPATCEGPKRITHLNDSVLSQIIMSPLESFWFTGAHDDKVEGFLVKPPNFDASKKYPVKFLIHGGPQGAWGDDWSYRWNPELFAANGFVMVMINFHGSTGYGQKFIDAINGDWGGAPFEDLMKGLDYAEQTYPFIDKSRECALGASYGGYMANWILGHTDRFRCIVSHDGMFNAESAWGTTEELWFNNWEFKGTPYDNRALYQKWSPHMYAKNFKTPTLVVHGQRDYRLDVSQGFDLFTTLQMLSVPSEMLYFPDEGHWVLKPQNSELWYRSVNDWVDRWTK
jgi:dipeptidyl aminopeptidase/acylaminoacyl peptidase